MFKSNRDAYFATRKAPGPLKVEVGERVAYTRYFLKQIGVGPTDDMWRRRGEVKSLHANGRWASVLWDGDEEPTNVALCNLAKPGPNLRFNE